MKQPGKIRVKVFGLIRDKERLFVSEDYDRVKQEKYYRALGGSIEFGETSHAALQREFKEEIQAELINIRYLGCRENLFTCEGKPGYEIVQVYECDFFGFKFYKIEKLVFFEAGNSQHKAMWIDIFRFKSGELRLVPKQFADYV